MTCSPISESTIACAPLKVVPDDIEDQGSELLNEDIQEAFYSQGINDEFMAAQARLEARTFGTVKSTNTANLPSAIRGVATSFMHRMVFISNLEADTLYEMIALFDLYCFRCDRDVAELCKSLPVVIGAIVRLVAKHHNQSFCEDGCILALGASFKNHLASSYGVSSDLITVVATNKMEMVVLETTGWNVILPTVHWWSVSLMARFTALLQQRDLPRLSWIWQQHTMMKMAQLTQIIKPADLAPRHLAVGIFALGLARANMLPVSVLFPDENEAWKHFVEHNPQGYQASSSCISDGHKALIEKMQIATGATLESIREHCHAIMSCSIAFARTQFGVSSAGG